MEKIVPEKRIALICQHFYPEMLSTGLIITQLATGLTKKGWLIRVYCGQPVYGHDPKEVLPKQSFYEGVEIVRIPTLGSGRGNLAARAINAVSYLFATIWSLFRDRKELSGIINTTNPPFIGIAAGLLKQWNQIPMITILHDIYPDAAICVGAIAKGSWIAWLWERVTQWIFKQSACLVVIGRDMEKLVRTKLDDRASVAIVQILNWADESKLYPIPHAENPFRQQHNPKAKFVVQYAGRMGRMHNLELLLAVAHQMKDEPICFHLIGDGAKRSLFEKEAIEIGLQNVQFLPYQPFDKLTQALSSADLAIVSLDTKFTGISVPSKSYGIMACARPIMAFVDTKSEIGLMIEESDCGVVLSNPTTETVVSQIHKLIASEEERDSMGYNGYHCFLEKYTMSLAIQKYDILLRKYF